MKEILYILLDYYAEHEIGFMPGAVSTDATGFRKEPKYINKMVAPTMEPVKSIGGMRTVPDYTFETMPIDYAALVLIGGFGWMNPEAERVLPIVKGALSVDGISAVAFMPHNPFAWLVLTLVGSLVILTTYSKR